MVFPIAGGNGFKGCEIRNCLRFNDGDSPKLEFTPSSTGNRRTFTFSFWFKRGVLGTSQYFFYTDNNGSGSTDFLIFINSSDGFRTGFLDSSQKYFGPSRVLRDPSAWYHAVVAVDTTQASASNRIKIYINGVEETDYAIDNRSDLGQNTELDFSRQAVHRISGYSSSAYIDGYLTEYHVVDGTALDATSFGEFDDNGVWIPKKYTGTYGTNGFFLEFKQTGTSANSSGIGADTSGNDNHFTPNNLAATDVTTDTCTNNFATMNPLESDRQQGGAATFAEGNLQITTSYVDSNYQRYPQVYSTQAVSSGKWYFEMKISTSDTDSFIGVHSPDNYASDSTTNPYGGYASTGAIYTSRGAVRINDAQTTGLGTTSQNDIVGCALDIDNNKVYFHKNGTYVQSGDPAGNSGGQAIPSGYIYGFTVGNDTSSNSGTMQVNFGNPVHTISSGNTDGKYGNFEYAVPSGFYAVCTKRLAEFG